MSMTGWHPLPSAPRYFANELGQIIGPSGRILRPNIRRGYPCITVCFADGTEKNINVHILICEAFHGPRPSPIHQAAHWDGNTRNSRPDNLRWATPRENTDDKKRHGTWSSKKNYLGFKLNEFQVTEIRKRFAGAKHGEKSVIRTALAREFGISPSYIRCVIEGRKWKHVPPYSEVMA